MLRSTSMRLAVVSAGFALSACSTADGGTPAAESTSTSATSAASAPSATSSPDPSRSTTPADERPTKQGREAFAAEVSAITPVLAQRMRWSHRDGCPVGLDDLRHLRLSYVDFDGAPRTGELVVNRDVAQDVVGVFRRLYAARWPIARMQFVDEYRGEDDRSMAADNTSAYNCRRVAGSSSWSEHAYGRAVDLNPVENPYVRAGSVAPPDGERYAGLDRSPGATVPPGVLRAGDVVVRAFAEAGWTWGGTWTSSKDYQHFSLSGRGRPPVSLRASPRRGRCSHGARPRRPARPPGQRPGAGASARSTGSRPVRRRRRRPHRHGS